MARVQEDVTISFSRIHKAGFYSWGGKAPTFGSVDETLGMLRVWGNGKAIPLTKCIDPDGVGDDDRMPAYLLGAEPVGDDWIVGIWNEIESTDGSVASVPMNAVVGAVQADMSELPEDSIPGFATYFWLLPKRGLIATIRFQHRATGLKTVAAYLERFLGAYSRNAMREKQEDGILKVVGYSKDGKGQPLTNLHPRFRVAPYEKDGELEHLRANVARIKRVLRRGHLTGQNPVDITFFGSLVRWARGKSAPQAIAKSKSVFVEFEYSPSLVELNAMIKAERQDVGGGAWDDLGFKIEGETKIFWVSKSAASDKFKLDVERIDAEMVELKSLGDAIREKRDDILRLL